MDTFAPAPPRRSSPWPWILMIALVTLGTVGLIWWRLSEQDTVQPPPVAPHPLAPEARPPAAPPLDEAQVVKAEELLSTTRVSPSPLVQGWQQRPGLVRIIAGTVDRLADHQSPRELLGFLGPSSGFSVDPDGDRLVMAPASAARYDDLAEAVASIDVRAAGSLLRTTLPVLEAALAEISARPEVSFRERLREALEHLLAAPVPEAPVEVLPLEEGVGYRFADPTLEALSPAQKHLVRMGADNQQTVQRFARAFLAEL